MLTLPSGPHFQTLRLYFDGCEAMATYQRGERRWPTYTAPDLILARALTCRHLSLTEGFLDLSLEHLAANDLSCQVVYHAFCRCPSLDVESHAWAIRCHRSTHQRRTPSS